MSELVWVCAKCNNGNLRREAHCLHCGEAQPPYARLEEIRSDTPLGLELMELSTPSAAKRGKRSSKGKKEASKKEPKQSKKAPKISTLEWQFMALWESSIFADPTPEFRFHPKRRWRFDFAWPAEKIAVECEGGTWSGGRHTRGKGYEGDCEKYNEAVILGWRVLRFTKIDRDAIEKVETLFRQLEKMEKAA
jgi:very-short-patch-repair endonuclease